MMESDTVKLIIKAPNQQIKDQLIKCDIGWSIGRLKEYLSEVYPSKPVSSYYFYFLLDIVKSCESYRSFKS